MQSFRLLTAATLIGFCVSGHADWVELFEIALNPECTPADAQALGDKVSKRFGAKRYKVEVLATQHGLPQTHVIWLGRSPDAEAWGKAHDTWRDEIEPGGEFADIATAIAACGAVVRSSTHVSVK